MLTATDPRLDADLADCEGLLHTSVQCPGNPFLTAVADHLLMAGGKRLRPMLALLAARFGDPGRTGVIRAAAVVELLHVASLYHDDVMDQATVRRGVPSVNARWGNRVAILAGDYLAEPTTVVISAIAGAAGVGKTALAVYGGLGCSRTSCARTVDGWDYPRKIWRSAAASLSGGWRSCRPTSSNQAFGYVARVLRHGARERLPDGHRFLGTLWSPHAFVLR